MAVITFSTLDGEVVSESRGGTRRDFLPDPLGSTAALLDSSQTKTDTWAYWPYGEERARTGTTPTPFQFVGTLGYYRDSSERTYIRARSYRTGLSKWMTVDPLWPNEEAYGYTKGNPSSWTDPSGMLRRTCRDVKSCLQKDQGYDCKTGSGCHKKPKGEVDIALALCVFYHESGLNDDGGPKDNGGGIGQHTCGENGSIYNLIQSGCARGICCVNGKPSGVTGLGWCAGAQAAFMWMKCRGIDYPGGYGDDTYKRFAPRIRACAACVRNGGDCIACGKKHIGDRDRGGN